MDITALRRITDKKVIDGFEVSGRVKNAANKDIGERIMDIRATDGTLFEIKGWSDKTKSLEYLLGKVDDEGGIVAGKISAQLLKDIVSKTINKNEKRIWVFADESMEALKPQFAVEIIKKIEVDTALQSHLAKNMGSIDRESFLQEYVLNEKRIQDAVKALMGNF